MNVPVVETFKNVFKLYSFVLSEKTVKKVLQVYIWYVLGSAIIEEQFVQKHSITFFNHRMRMFFPALF